MNSKYKLTIIISNYNQEEHISETIDSVFEQIVDFPFKVIITDDNSCKDNSKEIIQEYADKYPNIETIFAKENKGYLANILRAKERLDTPFFCLLDADDYWTDKNFLQRAYDFLSAHEDYSVYEGNVIVVSEDGHTRHPFISTKFKSGTYTKDMFLNNAPVPITQTTGMVLRNCFFSNGIPDIMKNAVGTRSERSFEGDTGRFIMHLKEGAAYYDDCIVGIYRKTRDGIWTSLSDTRKQIIAARFYPDYYQFYGSNVDFFVNKSFNYLQSYLVTKKKELSELPDHAEFIDEYERMLANDVYIFCKQYENELSINKTSLKDKIKQILRILKS